MFVFSFVFPFRFSAFLYPHIFPFQFLLRSSEPRRLEVCQGVWKTGFLIQLLVRGKIEASVLLQLLLIRVSFVVVWYYSGRSVKILNPDYWEGVVMLGRSRIPITG